jgi:L-iditol 2-dehydrogenase
MRVAVYYNNKDIRIEEMPVPEISDREILVKVRASGICGSDVMEWYRIKKAPRVLGHEITGEIVKVGKKVEKYKEGDRVFVSHHVPCNTCAYCLDDKHTLCKTLRSTNFYPGGFSEYIRVPEINIDRGVFLLPEEISYDEGVFIEPLACVVRGFRIAGMKMGKSIFIIGSGISGLLHIKLALLWNASCIFASDINDYRLEMARRCGANATIHAEKENVPQQLKKYNKGKLADFVVTCTGAPSAVTQAIQSVSTGGTILFFAPTEPGIEIPFPLFELWNKGVEIYSTYAGSPKDIGIAIELLKSKKIGVKNLITHRLPLSQAAKGFQLVANPQNSVKVILYP